jgi:hypothetical protein
MIRRVIRGAAGPSFELAEDFIWVERWNHGLQRDVFLRE